MINDLQLALKFRQGDDTALVELYQRYKKPLFVYCLRMLGDGEAAKDAVQETFTNALQARSLLRNPENIKSWLFTIARNYCYKAWHRKSRWHPLVEAEAQVPPDGSGGAVETADLLQYLLMQLKAPEREVFILRLYENLSYQEIALVTGASPSTIKSRLFKARKKLAEKLGSILS